MRTWKISIPVRPKAVQSVRGGAHGFYADHGVKKWKATIRPFIELACPDPPTKCPLMITRLEYRFKYPERTPKWVREYIASGGMVPYTGPADITDNLAKGLVDTCAGLVFENDKLIWRTCDIRKLYWPEDGMYIEFAETPDVVLVDGTLGDGTAARSETLLGI